MADEENSVGNQMSSSCTFFKKSKRKNNARKRKVNDSSSDEEEISSVVRPEIKVKKNHLSQSTGSASRLKQLKANESANKKLNNSIENVEDENESAVAVSYKSTRSGKREGPEDMGATFTLQVDTEWDKDAQAVFERHLEANKSAEGKEDEKLYKGQSGYSRYYEKKDTAQGNAASGMVRQGPIRAPLHLRSTIRWDYQPDICKDYKETGFCGFGDSCKFLHDRSDYKHGWQLEREFEQGTYDKRDPREFEISSDEDELPFACFICRERFKNPVVTRCKHYFCEACALKHFKKTSRCFVCGEQTSGVFNPAKDIIRKMNEEKAKGSKEVNETVEAESD